MRSFATVILRMLAPDTPSLLLLDEPEAFLHPPQARLLGEFIATERPARSQLFVATHSPEVLQGMLGAAPASLRVIRIQRDGSVNRVKELDKSQARDLSADPVMKFTSVLSGVFHKRVIICESDPDCMLYSALLDIPEVHGKQYPDVLFVQAGGKHRLYLLASALRALDVNVDVIADIDVLNNESVLQKLVGALGGNWDDIWKEAHPLKNEIEQQKFWLDSSEVVREIKEILAKAPKSGAFPEEMCGNIARQGLALAGHQVRRKRGNPARRCLQALPATSGFVQCNWTLDSSGRRTRRILQVRRQERPSVGPERARKV
jgi:hypothetical protein